MGLNSLAFGYDFFSISTVLEVFHSSGIIPVTKTWLKRSFRLLISDSSSHRHLYNSIFTPSGPADLPTFFFSICFFTSPKVV